MKSGVTCTERARETALATYSVPHMRGAGVVEGPVLLRKTTRLVHYREETRKTSFFSRDGSIAEIRSSVPRSVCRKDPDF